MSVKLGLAKAMRYCRFKHADGSHWGLIESVGGHDRITRMMTAEFGTPDPERLQVGEPCGFALQETLLLAPVQPSKIVCIGRNYREHAAELGHEVPEEPLIFLKPPTSLLDPGGTIVRPPMSTRVDHEGELGVVIGRHCRSLGPDEDVRPYICGYTCVNDVTARDLQKKDVQFTRGKGFDSFCPAGPLVADSVDPWAGVGVQTRVNGNLRQDGNTRDFIFPLDVIIRFISQIMTLLPGDLIATGTPSGVGPMQAGDVVEVAVEGIGALQNPVADEARRI